MLSIFSTLREVLFLAVKNFWFLLIICVVTETPDVVWRIMPVPIPASDQTPHGKGQIINLALIAILVFSSGVNVAAILGLLKRPADETAICLPIWISVKSYTLPLARLFILIGVIVILIAIPFLFLLRHLESPKLANFLLVIFYLVCVKYALADPLVVIENLNARAALRKSWNMVRSYFWYIGGCYLFLGTIIWVAGWLVKSPPAMTGASAFLHYCVDLTDSLWIILSWSMYHRIKAAEIETMGVGEVSIKESLAAPRSA